MVSHAERVSFSFGRNWLRYSEKITDKTVKAAEESLGWLLGSRENFADRSFLDIGCGSGLFAIAAARLGARPVVGIDIDIDSIRASRQNADLLVPNRCEFHRMSVLDREALEAIGTFDVVYAWGSLHHTGQMYRAIELSAARVKDGGYLILAIYNRFHGSRGWPSSDRWLRIKRLYNRVPRAAKGLMVGAYLVYIGARSLRVSRTPWTYADQRGMSLYHDAVDWLGGLPYEFANRE
jgi:2-polyprenyl-3-methyl-5-hydroxy-6-metoxy-1,4-benzoquinol methylase